MSLRIESDGIELRAYIATPEDGPSKLGLVLCHGFPQASREAASAGLRYAELADRIALRVGMTVLTFNFRGTGQSEGDFSLCGWANDLGAAVAHLRGELKATDVWLSGFGAGGSIALHRAGTDTSIKGVAAFSARAHFDDWADNAETLLSHARNLGTIRNPDYPPDLDAWTADLRSIRPIDVVGNIPPRALMLVHGNNDERVPATDAREMAAAAGSSADLRIIAGAGHRLRHDPRIVALLLGWLDRQK